MLLQLLFLTLAAAQQPNRTEIKILYNKGGGCNEVGNITLCGNGTSWNSEIQRCSATAAAQQVTQQPNRTEIKKLYNDGGGCNEVGNITLCGNGTSWNSANETCNAAPEPSPGPAAAAGHLNACNLDGIEVATFPFFYTETDLNVDVGDLVYWVNYGGFHDVNFEINTQTGLSFENPETFYLDVISGTPSGVCMGSHTFTIPGVYYYDCSVGSHAANGMVGTVTVRSPLTGNVDNLIGEISPGLTGDISPGLIGVISPDLTGVISFDLEGIISQYLEGDISGLTGVISVGLEGDISGLYGVISHGLTGVISVDLTGDISDLYGVISVGLYGVISPDLEGDISGLTGDAAVAPAVAQPDVYPVVEQMSTSVDGYVSYRLSLILSGDAANVYTIYGDASSPLYFPPSYQEAAPFGANVGGANPAYFPIMAGAEFDGWLTVGITDGSEPGALSSIGLDWAAWTTTGALATSATSDGAVFWMQPDNAPTVITGSNLTVVIAQITVPVGSNGTATMGAQGRSTDGGEDWREDNIQFTYP